MEFRIVDRPDGQFDIVQTVPRVVGTFPQKPVAAKVMRFLVDEAMDAAADEVDASTEAPAEQSGSNIVPVDWSADELKKAFARLEDGEKLRDVADDFGRSWTKLRGAWANRQKPALRAVGGSASDDFVDCRLCGKPFKSGSDANDLCARCSQ